MELEQVGNIQPTDNSDTIYIRVSNSMISNCKRNSNIAFIKSCTAKFFNNVIFFLIMTGIFVTTILGTLVSLLDINGTLKTAIGWTIAIIGSCTVLIKTVDSKYNFAKLAISYKNINISYDNLIRDILLVCASTDNSITKLEKITELIKGSDNETLELFQLGIRQVDTL